MKYILRLARFVSRAESDNLKRDLEKLGIRVLSSRHKIFKATLNQGQLKKIKDMPQVSSIEKVIFENQSTGSLLDLVKILSEKLPEKYSLNTKIETGVSFHKRAIIERLKKKKKIHDNDADPFVLEAYSKEKDTIVSLSKKVVSTSTIDSANVSFVLEEVSNPHEIADFMRLSLIFNAPLFLIRDSKNAVKRAYDQSKKLSKAEKSNKIQVHLINSITELNNKTLIGFSLWGKQTDKDIVSLRPKLKNKNLAIIFGNEFRGLKSKTIKECEYVFHLGPKSSEPFKANQAAAYFLALLNN